jgi:DNA-directed RNA polymerase specialized sigma24 family protein
MRNSRSPSPVSSIGERLRGPDARAAITQLFESMRPDLLRFAQWLARDRSIAEDIVQEALLRAWRSRDALKDPAAARAWLLTIVRREHARLYERKRLELVGLDDALETRDKALSEEIARELKLSSTAVLTRLFRARNKLRVICGAAPVPDVAARGEPA